MDNLFSVHGKTAVVTGGMGQLGMAYSIALAERGANVVILDVADRPARPDPVFDGLVQNGMIQTHIFDITRRDELKNIMASVLDSTGVPEILVNNAALDSPPDAPPEEVGPFETYPESSFDKVMAVNVKGTLNCCQVIGGLMAGRGKGSIINISSVYGILSPCQDIYEFRRKNGGTFFKPVAYSVSKSAILNLTRYLATYWARKGVRVNTLTLSGVFNNQPEEFLKEYCARIPIGRMANVEEVLGAIIFLASDASTYMTGSNLTVDGGWSAW